jgi:hypothetical protein
MTNTPSLIGATIRAANRTYGLAPARDYGPDETVVRVDAYDSTVYTAEGNCYLNGGYLVMRLGPSGYGGPYEGASPYGKA